MNTPRFAVAAMISALSAAPAFSQPLSAVPAVPAPSAQCMIGAPGCGASLGSIMDPMAEGALVGLSQSMVPPLGGGSDAAAKKAPPVAIRTTNDPELADAGTDLVAIGGQIINPGGSAAPFHSATGMNLGASAAAAAAAANRPSQAAFDTHVDGSGIAAPVASKVSNLSFVKAQKAEAAIEGKGAAFGNDPKLSAGDADFGAGGTRASSNGR